MRSKKLFFVLLVLYALSIIALNMDNNPWTITAAVLCTGAFLSYVLWWLIADTAQMERLMKKAKILHKPISIEQMEGLIRTSQPKEPENQP